MIYVAAVALSIIALFTVTWWCYLGSVNFVRNRSKVKGFVYAMGAVLYWFTYILDILFNCVVGTMSFLELPKELLFSERCSRWVDSRSWRGRVAQWYCHNMLDPFDPAGKHC